MKNRRSRLASRMARLERKCDRILAELLVLKVAVAEKPDLDSAIDRLHDMARKMKVQTRRDRETASRLFNLQSSDR